jgi:hypothetical protein
MTMIKITSDNMDNCSVILNDGETHSPVQGCRIALFTSEQIEELDAGADPRQLDTPYVYVDVRHLLAWALASGYRSETERSSAGGEG